MVETKESRNDQGGGGSQRMIINVSSGGAGGGSIGAVVLLGGALVTAAFASVFVLGQKRRRSDDDGRKKSPPKINEKSHKEDDHISRGEKEDVEKETGSSIMVPAHISEVDEIDAKVETDSEKLGDAEGDPMPDDGFVPVKEETPFFSEKEEEKESDGDGEIETAESEITEMESSQEENGDQEDIEVTREENGVEDFGGFCNGDGEIDEEECVEPEGIERGEGDLSDDGELVQVNEAIVGNQENEVESMEEETFNECSDNEVDEDVDDGEYGETEEVEGIENGDEGDDEQELIDHGNGEATMSSIEASEKKSLVHISAAMDNVVMDYNVNRIKDLSNEEVSTGRDDESKWEALWQAEWPNSPQEVKLKSYEVRGKIQEDKPTLTNNYTKDSTRRNTIIWALSVLSSLSCSWFFDLSFAKLCLIVFLTVFLLEMYGFSMLSRRPARCLHGAKGEGAAYDQRISSKVE